MLERYFTWMRDESLAFWLKCGADPMSGFFWERLNFDGTPVATAELRIRTQARQIYVFAHAAYIGLAPRGPSLALSGRALARLLRSAWAPDGRPGWVHRLSSDGQVVDNRRDLYDHAFILHALGWFVRATGDDTFQRWIEETVGFMDAALAAPGGGWAESDRHELPRRQNPHMHAFEAFLALYEATSAPIYLARAGELFGLFRTRFFHDNDGLLREFYGPNWEIDEAYHSDQLDPGHMLEWVWLLRRYARASGRPVGELCTALFDSARKLGLEQSSGFIADMVDATGCRLIDSRRLWPQTEYLKALLVEYEARDSEALRQDADGLADRLLSNYLTGCAAGTWRDQFTLDGRCTTDAVPASTLYHLFAAAVEITRVKGVSRSDRPGATSK
jgi:mannose/cellobiose epimerase-like protein (N-acyl-D-glucosamine 2-epimerase family)